METRWPEHTRKRQQQPWSPVLSQRGLVCHPCGRWALPRALASGLVLLPNEAQTTSPHKTGSTQENINNSFSVYNLRWHSLGMPTFYLVVTDMSIVRGEIHNWSTLGHPFSFPRVAFTKYHTESALNQRHLFSHSSGGWKSEIKVLAGPCSLWRHQGRIYSRSPSF